jgi:nitroreductase
MNFLELAINRYSCKKFDSRQISKEQLDSILEAGRLAPTAKNLQEQHVYVVQVEQIEENVINSSFTGLETL